MYCFVVTTSGSDVPVVAVAVLDVGGPYVWQAFTELLIDDTDTIDFAVNAPQFHYYDDISKANVTLDIWFDNSVSKQIFEVNITLIVTPFVHFLDFESWVGLPDRPIEVQDKSRWKLLINKLTTLSNISITISTAIDNGVLNPDVDGVYMIGTVELHYRLLNSTCDIPTISNMKAIQMNYNILSAEYVEDNLESVGCNDSTLSISEMKYICVSRKSRRYCLLNKEDDSVYWSVISRQPLYITSIFAGALLGSGCDREINVISEDRGRTWHAVPDLISYVNHTTDNQVSVVEVVS
ncbi:uncharacterized protein LOC102802056 [Saccoglossus kowalevskii]|uniref:Uncharacterized protein LOC102802056 n=1 Tax=Saccoglossus kowalevskii TaxID=10224 RepID=A0ABM0M764_SACKO|nr:PREDICTED: uncharacterized protein LOC102802056 [Saccoglossus kowalevskii]